MMDARVDRKLETAHLEKNETSLKEANIHDVAAEGYAAPVDEHGHAHIVIDPVVERALVRKLDLHCLPPLFLIYTFSFIDRSNIGNARLAGLEADLGLVGTDYNLVVSAFFIAYIVFSLFSNVPCKLLGPSIWLPLCSVLFGIISLCTAFTQTRGGIFAVRFILGMVESAMLPGIAFYISRFYIKREIAFRIAIAQLSVPVAGAFGGLLASGVLSNDHIGSLRRWRQLFFVEGIITIGIGIIAYLIMPHSLERARWLKDDQRELGIARIKAENAGTTRNVEKLQWGIVREGLCNLNAWLCGLWYGLTAQSVSVISFFLPTIVRGIFPTYTTIEQQLMTVPPYIFAAAPMMLITYSTFKYDHRGWFEVLAMVIGSIGFILFLATPNGAADYIGIFFAVAGAFPGAAIAIGWSAANAGTDTARAIAIGVTCFGGNAGNLLGTWTVLPQYAPRYFPAQGINLAFNVCVAIICILQMMYQRRENAFRERGGRDYRLAGLTPEREATLGRLHPKFRYKL